MKTEDDLSARTEFLVSEQSLPVDVPAAELLTKLRNTRTTGQLTYNFIDGGIRNIMLTRRTRVAPKDETRARRR